MSKSSVVVFITVSILLLVGVFFVFMIADVVPLSNLNMNNDIAQNNDGIEIMQGARENDPLISSTKEIYYSYLDESDPERGNSEAEIVILEFGDFECVYCAQMEEVLIPVLSEYGDRVKLVWKDFPNPVHLQAKAAALSARCAQEQDKFWEYHDYLFANQEDLSRELYNNIALELELDLPEFNSCLDSQKYIKKVGQGLSDGQNLGADATPYLFVGNTIVDQVISADELKGIIRRELGN